MIDMSKMHFTSDLDSAASSCPFCNSMNLTVVDFSDAYNTGAMIRCTYCGAQGPPYEIFDEDNAKADSNYVRQQATDQWNRRGNKEMIRHGKPPVSVMQEWTWNLSFMQQTVLLTAIRGPDNTPKYGPVKMLMRWYRRCILVSSLEGGVITNPYQKLVGGSFMGPSYYIHDHASSSNEHVWPTAMDDIVSAYLREVDALPHHFHLHLMHAFQIVGYKHPDTDIGSWFQGTYERFVYDMHLNAETEEHMDKRLSDNRDSWLESNDKATVE